MRNLLSLPRHDRCHRPNDRNTSVGEFYGLDILSPRHGIFVAKESGKGPGVRTKSPAGDPAGSSSPDERQATHGCLTLWLAPRQQSACAGLLVTTQSQKHRFQGIQIRSHAISQVSYLSRMEILHMRLICNDIFQTAICH